MLAAVLAGAPGAVAQTGPVPEPLVRRVADAVAERWAVPADRIRLSWGATRAGALDPDGPVRLIGGDGGWFAVVIGEAGSAAQVRAGRLDTVMVASRDLPGGATLAAGDFEPREQLLWGSEPAGPHPRVGWEVRRSIPAGDRLRAPLVLPPEVIGSGDQVAVHWSSGAVTIGFSATAINAARLGSPVRLRVAGRPGLLTATATGPGAATLSLKDTP